MKQNNGIERTKDPGINLFTFFIFVWLLNSLGIARINEKPKSFTMVCRPLIEVDVKVMPPVDNNKFLEEDKHLEEDPTYLGPFRFAISIQNNLNLKNSGTWEILPDGSHLWRLRIISRKAESLNLGITKFKLPQGAKLWIYNLSGKHVEGPYTSRHRTAAGQLWTPIIVGDQIVVEVFIPKGMKKRAKVKIEKVNHAYLNFNKQKKQGACYINVICPQGNRWRDQIRSVAMYHISGSFGGSGVLINNTKEDFRPLFVTAYHIDVRPWTAHSMVVYWNYESLSCDALGGGSTSNNQTGAKFLVGYKKSDFALVELCEKPDPSFDVFYSGWDARSNIKPQSPVGIHHPKSKEKVICFADNNVTSTESSKYDENPNANFWRINKWNKGVTVRGSSGSGLWDYNTQLLVGCLKSTWARCRGGRSNKESSTVSHKFCRP